MLGLNIHLLSFRLTPKIFQQNDKIRVSITTIPENNKEVFLIDANKLSSVHHFIAINITEKTRKLLFVFRKKSFIHNDPIIASTIVHANQLPSINSLTCNTEVQTFKIYEPRQNHQKDFESLQNRQIYGQMSVQFGISHPLLGYQNGQICPKIKSFNENQNQNNSIFIDSGITN